MNDLLGTPQFGRSITLRDLADRCERLVASTAERYPSRRVRISNPMDDRDAVAIPCDTRQFFHGNIVGLRDPETKETIKVKVEETRGPSDFILWVI